MKPLHIADLFCGAGGTSAGAVEAIESLGYTARLTAINHWPVAVATHTVNHPDARHLCTSIDDANPRNLFSEGQLDLLWASPECTHHSVARGGKPINDQSRATAWCVVRWAEALRPPVILVENVPEFLTWGPIGHNGRPLKSRKGEVFRAWVAALRALGYRVDHRLLCSADYGDPTTRTRLFVQAVRGRRKIVWPDPTHTKGGATDLLGSRLPWVPARRIIDFKIPSRSIFNRDRPLSPKTMRRIEAGLRKFGLKDFIIPQFGERAGQEPRTHDLDQPAPSVTSHGAGALIQPFILPQHSSNGPRSIEDPAPTVTTTSRGVALVEPFITSIDNGSVSDQAACSPIDDPLSTIVTKARHCVVQPFLVELRGTADKQLEGSSRSLDSPVGTITAGGVHHGLVESFLLPQQQGGALRPVSEPAPTVATAGAIALVEPFLTSYYGTGGAQSIDEPLDTVTTKDRHALVLPIVEINGTSYRLDIHLRMLQPHELAGAQGFRRKYKFTGTKSDAVKQIGNAVSRRLARALAYSSLSQSSDVSHLLALDDDETEAAA